MSVNEELPVNPVWNRRACPICRSLKISIRPDSAARKPAEKMSWDEAKSYFIGLRNDQVFFSYYRCLDCGLLYCPWYFTKEQIAILYSEMPDNAMGEDKSTVSKTQSAYAKWILRDGVSSANYLEVGPDIGLVSRNVIALQTPKSVSFIEPNLSVRQELVESSSKVSSIEVVNFIENLQNSEFTLIFCFFLFTCLFDRCSNSI